MSKIILFSNIKGGVGKTTLCAHFAEYLSMKGTIKTSKMSEKTTSAGQPKLSATFVVLAVTFCVCLITSNLFVPRLWRVGNTYNLLSSRNQ